MILELPEKSQIFDETYHFEGVWDLKFSNFPLGGDPYPPRATRGNTCASMENLRTLGPKTLQIDEFWGDFYIFSGVIVFYVF